MKRHERYMQEALAEAEEGARQGEVPVGALGRPGAGACRQVLSRFVVP